MLYFGLGIISGIIITFLYIKVKKKHELYKVRKEIEQMKTEAQKELENKRREFELEAKDLKHKIRKEVEGLKEN